jgi:hypothetical protein
MNVAQALIEDAPHQSHSALVHAALTVPGTSVILSTPRQAPRHVVRQRGYLCHM